MIPWRVVRIPIDCPIGRPGISVKGLFSMSTPQNIYDNPEFFARYDRMRVESLGRAEAFEYASIRSLLPDVRGLRVLDMACGAGEMCRWLADSGAASVTGFDVSERMIATAKSYGQTRITYIRVAAEDAEFEPGVV